MGESDYLLFSAANLAAIHKKTLEFNDHQSDVIRSWLNVID
jgi:hypothetical protein